MLSSTLGRRKVGETFPKSAGCTLEEQKRPKVLPKGFGASLKCIVPKEYVEVTFRLKITNDFVMAILSRSSSIEILAPQSLKDRMYDIWTAAPGRNK